MSSQTFQTIDEINADVIIKANTSVENSGLLYRHISRKKVINYSYDSCFNEIISVKKYSTNPTIDCPSGWRVTGSGTSTCCQRKGDGRLDCGKVTTRCDPGYHHNGDCWPYCSDAGYAGWERVIDIDSSNFLGNLVYIGQKVPACKNPIKEKRIYKEIAVSIDFDFIIDTSKTRLENVVFDNRNVVYFATIVFTINICPDNGESNSIGFWSGSKVINCNQEVDTTSGVNSNKKLGWFKLTPGTVECKQRIIYQFDRKTMGIPPCIPYGQTTTPLPMNIFVPTCGTLPPNPRRPGFYPDCNLPPDYVVQGLQTCTYAPLNYTTPPPLIQSPDCQPFSLTINRDTASAEAVKKFGKGIQTAFLNSCDSALASANAEINSTIISALNGAQLTVIC